MYAILVLFRTQILRIRHGLRWIFI